MRDWKKWAIAALKRAVRTFAQTALGMITVGAAFSEIDWEYMASVSGVAAAASILMSLAGLPEVPQETAPEIKEDESDETDEE